MIRYLQRSTKSVQPAIQVTEPAFSQSLHDIIVAEENQAAPKKTFGFPAALTSKRPMKSDKKRESAVCECR